MEARGIVTNFPKKRCNSSDGNNVYSMHREVALDMDENKTLEKYIDRLAEDSRERETRLSRNMEQMEQRLADERKESENRIEALFKMTSDSIKDTNQKIDLLNTKIDNKVDTLNINIDTKVDSISEKIDSINKWIIGLCISTIIGIAAIAVTVIIAFWTK